jgi:hypothetical protein
MVKWKLMLATMPFVVATVACKLFLENVVDFHGIVDFSDVGIVLNGGVFLIGFMLAGTMSDFKESERLPADMACSLEAIEEAFVQASVGRPVIDVAAGRRAILDAAKTLDAWLHKKTSKSAHFEALSRLAETLYVIEGQGAGPHATRGLRDLAALRRTVSRIDVISRTGFIASGYALIEVVAAVIIFLIMISKFKSFVVELVIAGFVTLIFVYMIKLIRDIDDPFEYTGTGGAAEVNLFPLVEYQARLEGRLEGRAIVEEVVAMREMKEMKEAS